MLLEATSVLAVLLGGARLYLLYLRRERMNVIEKLTEDVRQATTVMGGAVVFIAGLRIELAKVTEELKAGGADVTALDNLAAQLEAGTDGLVKATAENTVASSEVVKPAEGDAPAAQ